LSLSSLEAVLFDAGGTLVRIDYAFIVKSADRRGALVSEQELARGEAAARCAIDERAANAGGVLGNDASRISEYFETLLRGAGIGDEHVSDLVVAMQAGHDESNLWRVPMEGAFDLLAGLRARGIRAAVISNSDGRVREKLASLGFAGAFEFVVDSHEEGVEKPDPEIFRRALDRLGVPPERAAYIGDIYSIDAVGARAAGMRPILVDSTGAYHGIDCTTIESLTELLEDLDRGRIRG
jgi:putative hydrolase of the HAD superfamily